VRHTGAERSTPRPLTVSNLLYSQHQGDNQHKDGGCKPHDKIRLAKIATGQATPARDNYLPADPRLAEAHNYSTVVPCTGADRSGQQTITGTNSPQPQHLNNEGNGTNGGKAGTKLIIILKANGTIHAKLKKKVKEDTAKMNKDKGAGQGERDAKQDREQDDDGDAINARRDDERDDDQDANDPRL
jgi:hypothetical protein